MVTERKADAVLLRFWSVRKPNVWVGPYSTHVRVGRDRPSIWKRIATVAWLIASTLRSNAAGCACADAAESHPSTAAHERIFPTFKTMKSFVQAGRRSETSSLA